MSLTRFKDKVALISGGTQGIGFATARRLGQEGCKVVVSSRKQKNVDEAVKTLTEEGIEVSGVAGNLGKKSDRLKLIQQACDKYGGFDCLFISAGVNPHLGSLLDVTEEQFDKTFGVNVKANFQFIQETIPYFEQRGSGSVVTNATLAMFDALFASISLNLPLYSLSKLCQTAMVQHTSLDCLKKNIRINCVAPGTIETAFLRGGLDLKLFQKYWNFSNITNYEEDPVTRVGKPEEIASVVAFLLSDDASFVTGNCILPCGGLTLNRFL